ncbi:CBS domain-containing protein CBSCBSPB3 isoform X1 [Selaginella moellendorffii]|uniref:CBS domain-containing protein CBSCBSPB3 isoform X1 n=1 Tax=Selaginella moellendorffii TaxID=88036 RepID=UPI000D1CB3E5|nr:CBS domain-containing protein CBSCBSPB3 isoform X1 [Selaginella moellendorffii]|eukprot:XP_024541562.1 CBS domain-containing protein CBSCBSPB3 isoform X1 [Selaginella moellendorffii]
MWDFHRQGKFRHLPVVDNGQVIALVNMKKCLYDAIVTLEWHMAASFAAMHPEKISAASIEALRDQTFQPTLGSLIMQSFNAVTICPNETVDTATKKMLEFSSDYVIVASGRNPVGIFTSKDLLMRVVAKGLCPTSTAIEKVMTRNVECASLDTAVVDALHIMHDGRFCHLPILDQDRNVVGCVSVMALVECGLASVSQKLPRGRVDYCVTLQVEEEIVKLDASNSVTTACSDSANLTSELIAVKTVYPSLWLANFFSFKVEDPKGCVHRFTCGTQSLEEVLATVSVRIGCEDENLQLLYKDDEGDLILLSSDNDLALAVASAKAYGMKVLRLYVDCPHTAGKLCRWKSLRRTVIASILVIVGLGFLIHARQTGNEPWKLAWNRVLSFRQRQEEDL